MPQFPQVVAPYSPWDWHWGGGEGEGLPCPPRDEAGSLHSFELLRHSLAQGLVLSQQGLRGAFQSPSVHLLLGSAGQERSCQEHRESLWLRSVSPRPSNKVG